MKEDNFIFYDILCEISNKLSLINNKDAKLLRDRIEMSKTKSLEEILSIVEKTKINIKHKNKDVNLEFNSPKNEIKFEKLTSGDLIESIFSEDEGYKKKLISFGGDLDCEYIDAREIKDIKKDKIKKNNRYVYNISINNDNSSLKYRNKKIEFSKEEKRDIFFNSFMDKLKENGFEIIML